MFLPEFRRPHFRSLWVGSSASFYVFLLLLWVVVFAHVDGAVGKPDVAVGRMTRKVNATAAWLEFSLCSGCSAAQTARVAQIKLESGEW